MSEELKQQRIPVSGPSITEHEIAYVTDAARTAWYAQHRVYHDRFEQAFASHLGVEFAMALPSCTAAIHLALAAMGVGPGDEVIVPDITWIASAAPISYLGATPVFADIDRDTWCIAASSLESLITARTKAVIVVDLYGSMPNWDDVLKVAQRHDIDVIEDAAEAVGSRYRDRAAGSFGRANVFSFHGSKTLTTGEGGMLATNDRALFDRAQVLRDHGRPAGDRFFQNKEVAYKYKMSSLQAALGLAQLRPHRLGTPRSSSRTLKTAPPSPRSTERWSPTCAACSKAPASSRRTTAWACAGPSASPCRRSSMRRPPGSWR